VARRAVRADSAAILAAAHTEPVIHSPERELFMKRFFALFSPHASTSGHGRPACSSCLSRPSHPSRASRHSWRAARAATSALSVALLIAASAPVQASIIENADINGVRTFKNTVTGTIWADLDNHRHDVQGESTVLYSTYGTYLAALQASGFQWANPSEVFTLLLPNIPLTLITQGVEAVEYAGYAAVMNSHRPDRLVRGIAGWDVMTMSQPGVDSDKNEWVSSSFSPAGNFSDVPTSFASGGIWAYYTGNLPPSSGGGVPAPATWALAGVALLLMGRRSRKQKAG
jgi:hypothetical protein